MEKSIYFDYVNQYFPSLVTASVEKLNDSNRPLTYMFRQYLTPRFSIDGRWAAVSGLYTRVAADIVATNSPLPLIKRDSVQSANGFLPKIGVKMSLNEQQMQNLDALIALSAQNNGQNLNQMLQLLFEDTPKVVEAVYERLEAIFLEGLSSGVAIADTNNVGQATRVNYGFKAANQFAASGVVWKGNESTAKPFDDIRRVADKAEKDGNSIIRCFADDEWIDAACASEQARAYYAFSVNSTTVANVANVPILDREQLATALQRKYNIQLVRVNRSVRTERDGVQTSTKPWKKGSATFVCDDNVGDLVWANCAEANHRAENVVYTTADDYILVSKYHKTDPIEETTASQARVVPVISNIDRIYTLDSTQVQA